MSVIAPNNVTTSSTKMHRYGIPQPIWQQIGSKTLTTPTTKLEVIRLTDFLTQLTLDVSRFVDKANFDCEELGLFEIYTREYLHRLHVKRVVALRNL